MSPDAVDQEEINVEIIIDHTLRAAALLMMRKEDLMPNMQTVQGNRCFISTFSQMNHEEHHYLTLKVWLTMLHRIARMIFFLFKIY